MSVGVSRTCGWFLAGWAGLAVVGCAPAPDHRIDALPWNAASVRRDAPETKLPHGAADEEARAPDVRELQFRDHIVKDHLDELRRIAARPAVVRAVQTANTKSWKTQQQIDEMDLHWRQTQGGDAPLIQAYLSNPCADLLRSAKQQNPNYVELFVMDNRGCIVAETDKTSDYWQGDEPKWLNCFNGGKGQVWVSDVEYDQSTRAYVVQVSVPIHNERGVTIGVLTASITPNRPQ
jgi:hypothetical protein